MTRLKLFVWEDVLADYTSGMVCVLAKNEKEAWELLYAEDQCAWWALQGEPRLNGNGSDLSTIAHNHIPRTGYYTTATRPQVVTEPKAFVVWGGG